MQAKPIILDTVLRRMAYLFGDPLATAHFKFQNPANRPCWDREPSVEQLWKEGRL